MLTASHPQNAHLQEKEASLKGVVKQLHAALSGLVAGDGGRSGSWDDQWRGRVTPPLPTVGAVEVHSTSAGDSSSSAATSPTLRSSQGVDFVGYSHGLRRESQDTWSSEPFSEGSQLPSSLHFGCSPPPGLGMLHSHDTPREWLPGLEEEERMAEQFAKQLGFEGLEGLDEEAEGLEV